MYKSALLSLIFVVSSMQAVDFNKPIAPKIEGFTSEDDSEDFWWGLEVLGYEKVSAGTEAFIREVMREMGLAGLSISCMKMSNSLVYGGHRENAFVIKTPSYDKLRIYVSEEWFNELSHEEKTFLIRHELTHIQKNHLQRKVFASLPGTMIFWASLSLLYKSNAHWSYYVVVAHVLGFSQAIIQSYVSRAFEREADAGAAKDAIGAQGGMKFFERIAAKRDFQSRFEWRRYLNAMLASWSYPFRTHPTDEERYEYCEKQYEKFAAEQVQQV